MSFTSFVVVLNEVVIVLLLDIAWETFESSLRIEKEYEYEYRQNA